MASNTQNLVRKEVIKSEMFKQPFMLCFVSNYQNCMTSYSYSAFAGPGTGLQIALVCREPRPSESGGRGFLPYRPVPHVREEGLRGEGEVPRREVRPGGEFNQERFANGRYAENQREVITDAECRKVW